MPFKNTKSFPTIVGLLFLLFFIPLKSYSASIGEITRMGSYLANGNYRWIYKCTISSSNESTEQLTVSLSKPFDFSFEISNLPAVLSVEPKSTKTIEFALTVPASYIKEPVNMTTFNLTLSLKSAPESIFNKKFTASGPLPKHPRLFVRSSELQDIKRRFSNPDFYDLKKVFNEQKSFGTDGKVTS